MRITAAAFLCLLAGPLVAAEPLAVLPLRPLGVKADAARALGDTLRAEVARIPDVAVVDAAAVARELRARPDCLASLSCAAGAAKAAGAALLVIGTVSELGELYMLDVKLLDASSGRELRRISHPVSGRKDQLLEAVRAVAVELVAPERYAGGLLVEAQVEDSAIAGADVYVDGKLVGRTPLTAPLGPFRPGQHALRVSKEGVKDADLFVDIHFDKVTVARVDLLAGAIASFALVSPAAARELAAASARAPGAGPSRSAPGASVLIVAARPPPRSPALRIAGFASGGLGIAAALAAVAFHAQAYATASDLNRREADGSLSTKDLSLYGDIDGEVKRARILYGVGAALAAGGIVALLYDRWLDRQPQPASRNGAPAASGNWRAAPTASGLALSKAF